MFRISVPEQIVGMSGLERRNSRKLPPLKNAAQKTGARIALALTDGQFPCVVDDEAMTDIKSGIATFLIERKTVTREATSSFLGWHERVRRVIDRMRERICSLNLEPARETLIHIHLQTVIPRVAGSLVQRSLEKGGVVDRHDPGSSEPQIAEHQGGLRSSVRDVRGHQCGLRRVSVDHSKLMEAAIPYVVDVKRQVPQNLALYTKVPTRGVGQREMGGDNRGEELRTVQDNWTGRNRTRQRNVLGLIEWLK